MAFNLDVIRAQVDGLFSADNDEISQLRRDRHIKAAVERYSQDKPREVVDDITGDGGKYYAITGLASFNVEFSQVIAVEYPAEAITADHVPQMLENTDWDDDYQDATMRYLFFPNHSPAATETARVRYTSPYLWTASTTATTAVNQTTHGFSQDDYVYLESGTWYEANEQRIATHQVSAVADADNFTAAVLEVEIPAADFFSVCNLAGSYICEAISGKYARTNDSTLALDAVDNAGRSERFAQRAKDLLKLYEDALDLGEENAYGMAHAEFIDQDPMPSWNGNYLFHGRR